MVDKDQVLERIRLACENVARLNQQTHEIEAGVKDDPEAAEDFIRPCGQLLQKLLEAQASVETLLQKLFVASHAEMAGRR